MRIILFIALIISMIFAKWIGVATSWLLTPIAKNHYLSILVVFALIFLVLEATGISKKKIAFPNFKNKITTQKKKGDK